MSAMHRCRTQNLVAKHNFTIKKIRIPKKCLILGPGQGKYDDEPGTSVVSESNEMVKSMKSC